MFVLLQQRCLLNLPQGKRWLRWVNERWVWKAEAVDDLSKPPRPSTETRKQKERGWPETSSITSIYLGPLCLKPSSYLVLHYSIKSLIFYPDLELISAFARWRGKFFYPLQVFPTTLCRGVKRWHVPLGNRTHVSRAWSYTGTRDLGRSTALQTKLQRRGIKSLITIGYARAFGRRSPKIAQIFRMDFVSCSRVHGWIWIV